MKYGPNTIFVEEIIGFVENGSILNGNKTLTNSEWEIISNFEHAKDNAWNKVIGKEEWLWTDIREREMSKVKGHAYKIEGFSSYKDNLLGLLNIFTLYLKRQIPTEFQDILDDAIGDLYNSAYNRCVFGRTNNFFENIYEIYKLGCWPCGWIGGYPNGQLCIFNPVRESK